MELRRLVITAEDRPHLLTINYVFEQLLNELAQRVSIPHKLPSEFSKIEQYLFGENELFASSLDKWVDRFVATGLDCRNLPDLDDNPQLFLLIQRVKDARSNVWNMMDQKVPRDLAPEVPDVPPTSDHAAFIRWLLIPEWELRGKSQLGKFVYDLLSAFGALGPHELVKR